MNKTIEKDRINEIIDVIMKVARGDYSVQVKLSEKNDVFDALKIGINMMIDDIRHDLSKRKHLEKNLIAKNIALKEVLEQITVEKKDITEKIKATLEKLIMPKLQMLRSKLPKSSRNQIKLIEKNIQSISSSFGKRISSREIGLSVREVEVCDTIKNGLNNKEIAKELKISLETVKTVRKNIRRKLKIRNKRINLRNYLQSL